MEVKLEIKMLFIKLVVFCLVEVIVVVLGSVFKVGVVGNCFIFLDVVQVVQVKEDFYGDLIGFIFWGVRVGKEEDVFDCIQIGCNGSKLFFRFYFEMYVMMLIFGIVLYFKLVVDKGDNYDDVQFIYSFQFDESRDEEFMDMLFDYLLEEIIFVCIFVVKFYVKVISLLIQ